MVIHIVKGKQWLHQLNPGEFLIEVEGFYGGRERYISEMEEEG